jgi:hypothetical protein
MVAGVLLPAQKKSARMILLFCKKEAKNFYQSGAYLAATLAGHYRLGLVGGAVAL